MDEYTWKLAAFWMERFAEAVSNLQEQQRLLIAQCAVEQESEVE
jgi:hypothetical protein